MKIIEHLRDIFIIIVIILFAIGAYKCIKQDIKDLNDKNKTP